MAKKKINKTDDRYYVYYDNKTGRILSVTNEVNSNYEYAIEPTNEEVNKLLTGEWSFLDYIVGYKRLADNTVIKAVVPVSDSEYSFRHNSFEWITEYNSNSEVLVEWNLPNNCWIISLSSEFKKTNNEIFVNKLLFFVTLETDFDFLIRTISIDARELLDADKISIPFVSKKELDIDTISISSKLAFKSYNLKITYE